MSNWATDKQCSFIKKLILQEGTKAELNGKIIRFDFGKSFRINSNNDSLITGGVRFDEASKIIGDLINKQFKIEME